MSGAKHSLKFREHSCDELENIRRDVGARLLPVFRVFRRAEGRGGGWFGMEKGQNNCKTCILFHVENRKRSCTRCTIVMRRARCDAVQYLVRCREALFVAEGGGE